MKITIYGASDDCVEVEGCEGGDEFYAENWHGVLQAPDPTEAMRVSCWYADNGCWQVGVGQADESIPLPPWPVTIAQQMSNASDGGYSAVLTIDAPEGTRLTNIHPKPSAG